MPSTWKLLVIGGGVVQRNRSGALCGKAPVINYMHELAEHFSQVIWAVTLESSAVGLQTPLELQRVQPLFVSGKSSGLVTDMRHLWSMLDDQTIVLLYLPNPWLAMLVLSLQWRYQGLFVYIANDYIQHSNLERRGGRGALHAQLYQRSHEEPIKRSMGVIARGAALAQVVSSLNQNVIETIPISHNFIAAPNRATLSSDTGNVRILYVGKLIKGKGVDILLAALSQIQQELLDRSIQLAIVGDGPEKPMLEQMAKDLKLDNRVEFTGYIDDTTSMGAYYSQAELVVVPSSTHAEGVPRVISEALMHGLPVIATNIGGIPGEYVAGEVFLVTPGSAEALAQAMRQVITDTDIRSKLLKAVERYQQRNSARLLTPARQHAEFIQRTMAQSIRPEMK